ncbi:MAG: endonuclease/exonuclease/phosphatase [Alphaproteobacteria bacterium]|nr:endonuclease/exonuclease/phosphatase [Alphaproteobacteria bacterium]
MRCLLLVPLVAACVPVSTDTGLPPPATRPEDSGIVSGVSLGVVGYNVESGDADPDFVATNMADVRGEAIWGFAEAANQSWLDTFAVAAADDASQHFLTVLGTTGFSDRLGLVYDDNVVQLLSSTELNEMNIGGTARAPLVGHFRIRSNGVELKVVVNHLWRTDDDARHEQARMLNEWAATQTLPLVAIGDYNFDWSVDGGESDHDAGYDLMTANSTWVWVRPDTLIATQCSYSFNGVLDFAFVANGAKTWDGTSVILFPENVHCQDSPDRPDHRPVRADFFVPDP